MVLLTGKPVQEESERRPYFLTYIYILHIILFLSVHCEQRVEDDQ